MGSVAFAVALAPGKSERLRAALTEFTTVREADYATRARHGLRVLRAWYQTSPAEMLVVYLEADDIEEFIVRSSFSDEPLQDWLEEVLDELTGGADLPDVEQVVDWDATSGHRLTASSGGDRTA